MAIYAETRDLIPPRQADAARPTCSMKGLIREHTIRENKYSSKKSRVQLREMVMVGTSSWSYRSPNKDIKDIAERGYKKLFITIRLKFRPLF